MPAHSIWSKEAKKIFKFVFWPKHGGGLALKLNSFSSQNQMGRAEVYKEATELINEHLAKIGAPDQRFYTKDQVKKHWNRNQEKYSRIFGAKRKEIIVVPEDIKSEKETSDQCKVAIKNQFLNFCEVIKLINKDCLDVTLKSSDHIETKSSKAVLSASSFYLKTLLLNHPRPFSHVLIVLSDIKDTTLQYVLTFIYTGEVKVNPEEKDNFITALKELRVKGFKTFEKKSKIAKDNGNSLSIKDEEDEDVKLWLKSEFELDEAIDNIDPIEEEIDDDYYEETFEERIGCAKDKTKTIEHESDIINPKVKQNFWTDEASAFLHFMMEENDGKIGNLLSSGEIFTVEKSRIFKSLANRLNKELGLGNENAISFRQVKEKLYQAERKKKKEEIKLGIRPKYEGVYKRPTKLAETPEHWCHDCRLDYFNAEGLKRHQEKKSRGKWGCGECDYMATCRQGMRTHYDSQHIKEPRAICEICSHPSSSLQTHYWHMNHYHKEKKFICQECGQKFATKTDLKFHNYVKHDETKKYACDRCPFTTKLTSRLKIHITGVHEGVKHKCTEIGCDLNFSTDNALQRHVRFKHKGIKYTCDRCGYECAQPNRLREHTEKHHSK